MAARSKKSLKTKPTDVNPHDFVSAVEHPRRREDGFALLSFFDRVTGLKPKMWGGSIVGYGRYAYSYDSGHSGEFFLTGFSPRKSALSIYIMPGYRDLSQQLQKLGKYKIGKSCLYINKLADVDMAELEVIVCNGVNYMRANYETWDE